MVIVIRSLSLSLYLSVSVFLSLLCLSVSVSVSPSQLTQKEGDIVTQISIKTISRIQELIDDLQSSAIQVTMGTLTTEDCQGYLSDYCRLLTEGAKVYVT